MDLISRLHTDADRLGATVVTEQVNPSRVRVLAENKDCSVLLCRLLAVPCGSSRDEEDYQSFLTEIA